MRKIWPIFLTIIFLTGCFNFRKTPTAEVEDFFSKYQKLDTVVLDQLDEVVDEDTDLTTAQKKDYKEAIKRQYQNLTYNIKEEEINADEATVTVEIEVYDYHKALVAAQNYLTENPDEFTDADDTFDESEYFAYKVDKMMNMKEKIKYTLNLTLTKENKDWVLDDLTEIDRSKIHGLYDYS